MEVDVEVHHWIRQWCHATRGKLVLSARFDVTNDGCILLVGLVDGHGESLCSRWRVGLVVDIEVCSYATGGGVFKVNMNLS